MRWLVVVILILHASNAFPQSTLPLPEGESRGEVSRVKIWNKDPFLPPSVGVESQETVKEEAPALTLSAILFSGKHSSAVINGTVAHLGDEVSGQKVLDIKRTYVILSRGKKSYRLELKK